MMPIDADSLDAMIRRGNALEAAGDAVGALAVYDEAARLAPWHSRPELNRGNVLTALGRFAEAESALHRAFSSGATAEARLNLGNLYLQQGRLEEASNAYSEALELRPGWESAGFGKLCVLYAMNSPDLLQTIERFLNEHASHADAHRMYRTVLSSMPPQQILTTIDPKCCNDPKLLLLRSSASSMLFDHSTAMADRRRALELDPSNPESICALAFASMVYPDTDGPLALLPVVRRAFLEREVSAPVLSKAPPYRIGYLSGDYDSHPAANFLITLLLNHRRERFHTVALANIDKPDAVTGLLRAASSEWVDLGGMDDATAEARLREERLDVIVDFSGWTIGNRLPVLARRIAPVQITTIGVYLTTGISAIDFRICDFNSDPPGLTESQHSETLLRTEGPHACYYEMRPIPSSPIQPARINEFFTFGYFNNSEKITRHMIGQWIEILRRAPLARLKILGLKHEASSRWLTDRFTEAGVVGRVNIINRVKVTDYDAMLTTVDLALDSYPYNGGTTTIETLLAGVPVLTQSGPWSFSRSARVFLDPLGLSAWAVDSADAFVNRAVEVATGPLEPLERLRAELPRRVRRSALMDQTGYIERWESVLLQAIKLRRATLRE